MSRQNPINCDPAGSASWKMNAIIHPVRTEMISTLFDTGGEGSGPLRVRFDEPDRRLPSGSDVHQK